MKKLFVLVLLFIGVQTHIKAQDTPKISVEGKSEINILPDEALIRVSLTGKAMKTQEATEVLNEKAAFVTKALRKSGVDTYELKADNYFVNVNRIYTKGTSKDSGYVASQTLKILVKDTGDDLLEIIEVLHGSANMAFQLQFQLSDSKRKEYEARLLQMAIRDAKDKAVLIGSSLELGELSVYNVSYGSGGSYQPKMYRSEAMMMNADNQRTAPTIQPDEQTLSDQINVVFTFK
jgi:uncharacterized protein YggE